MQHCFFLTECNYTVFSGERMVFSDLIGTWWVKSQGIIAPRKAKFQAVSGHQQQAAEHTLDLGDESVEPVSCPLHWPIHSSCCINRVSTAEVRMRSQRFWGEGRKQGGRARCYSLLDFGAEWSSKTAFAFCLNL